MMIQLCAITFYTYTMLGNRIESVRKMLLMPRRNAVGNGTLEVLDAVREWAESSGLRDSYTTVTEGVKEL
jgi:hypothetical protein